MVLVWPPVLLIQTSHKPMHKQMLRNRVTDRVTDTERAQNNGEFPIKCNKRTGCSHRNILPKRAHTESGTDTDRTTARLHTQSTAEMKPCTDTDTDRDADTDTATECAECVVVVLSDGFGLATGASHSNITQTNAQTDAEKQSHRQSHRHRARTEQR